MADTSLFFNIVARDKASKAFDKISGRAKLLGAAAGVMAIKFGKDSVSAFVEAEKAQNRLSDAFDKFPKLADSNIGRLQSLNSALALKTKFDDDATASGQAVLAQFDLTGKQLEDLTPLMQDFAAKTGRDLPTAAGLMGKAFLGNTKSLKALGINYKSTGDKTKDYAAITELMREKVGGFAEKEGKTAAGQAEILRNQFGELQEKVGSKLVPVLMMLGTGLLSVIAFTQKYSHILVPLAAVIGTLATVIWATNVATRAWTATTKAAAVIQRLLFTTTVAETGATRASTVSRIANSVAAKAQLVWGKAVAVATKAWAAAQWLLNVALTANPIGLVVAAIALLVVGIIIAWKKSETFRNVVTKVFVAVGMAAVRMALTWLSALGKVFGALGKIPGKLGAPFRAAAGAIDKARGKVLQMQAALNRLKSKSVTVKVFGAGEARRQVMALNNALARTSGAHVSIGGVGTGISAYASGTSYARRGLAVVGEDGPELMEMRGGEKVHSAAATARMAGSAAAATASGGGFWRLHPDDRALLTALAQRPITIAGKTIQQSLLQEKRSTGGSALGLA